MEWISVNDRLPENISTVIVAVKEMEYPTTAWYSDLDNAWYLTEKDFFRLKNNEFTVTHWMPLPEPPEEEIQ